MDYARLIVLAVAYSTVVCAIDAQGDEPEGDVFFERKDSAVRECRISLYLNSQQALDWRIKDVNLMKELLLNPLESSKRDPRPAAYETRGSVTITRQDDSKEVYIMFDPWGHIKRDRDNAYLIADLDRLRTAFKESIKGAIQSLE